MKIQIKKLLPPCHDCVRDVHKALQSTVEDCLDADITFRFPRLTEHLVGSVHKFLTERLAKVIEALKYHIEIESAYTSTSRKDFRAKLVKLMAKKNINDSKFAHLALAKVIKSVHVDRAGDESENILEKPMNSGSEAAFEAAFEAIDENTTTVAYESDDNNRASKNKKPTEMKIINSTHMLEDGHIVRNLIEAYFEIVRQSIRDYVPKLLTHSLIYYTCDNLQVYLVSAENLSVCRNEM